MKTTIDIAEPLLAKAKERAAREGTTLRDVVERGLRIVVSEEPVKPFRYRAVTYRGSGLAAGLSEDDWSQIRALAERDWPGDRD